MLQQPLPNFQLLLLFITKTGTKLLGNFLWLVDNFVRDLEGKDLRTMKSIYALNYNKQNKSCFRLNFSGKVLNLSVFVPKLRLTISVPNKTMKTIIICSVISLPPCKYCIFVFLFVFVRP